MPNIRRHIFLPIFLIALPAWAAAEPVVDWDKANAETLVHYQSIVRINSSNPPGNETLVVNYLKDVLDREGISYQVFALEPGRANLVARLKGNGRKKPILILGHTDTVGVYNPKCGLSIRSAPCARTAIYGAAERQTTRIALRL